MRSNFLLAGVVLVGFLGLPRVQAQVAAPDPGPSAAAPAVDPATRYELPPGDDTTKLAEFIVSIRGFEPSSADEARFHYQRKDGAILAAAQRILELEKDQTSPVFRLAFTEMLCIRADRIGQLPDAEQKKLFGEITTYLRAKAFERDDLRVAIPMAQRLDQADATELAIQAYEFVSQLMRNSGDQEVAAHSDAFEGTVRRLRLPGNAMEVEGTTYDGQPFDLTSLRGKVILIDFWATWCGPCVAEIPNIRRNYEAYHAKGFEVVGVNLDDNRGDLDAFMEKERLPWTTLVQTGPLRNPVADKYGVSGIPTLILIDQDFKVVSLSARGERLNALLAQLLGPVDAAAAPGPIQNEPAPPGPNLESGANRSVPAVR